MSDTPDPKALSAIHGMVLRNPNYHVVIDRWAAAEIVTALIRAGYTDLAKKEQK